MKTYTTPLLYVRHIDSADALLTTTSLPVGGGTVDDENDIGWVKEKSTNDGGYNVWNDDWSK